MQRVLILGVLAVGAAASGALALLAWSRLDEVSSPSDEARLGAETGDRRSYFDSIVVPDFTMIDQDGEPFARADLGNGEDYVVLDFMFSHCQTACPIMTGNMLRVYHQTAGLPVRFVSVSVDPEHDTPERLREHAATLGVDTERWTFLTGDWAGVTRLAEALGFSLTLDTGPSATLNLPGGGTMTNIVHPTRFVLFTPEGRIHESYLGMDRGDVDRLLRDLDGLVRGAE